MPIIWCWSAQDGNGRLHAQLLFSSANTHIFLDKTFRRDQDNEMPSISHKCDQLKKRIAFFFCVRFSQA
jgi:hypothetical protein